MIGFRKAGFTEDKSQRDFWVLGKQMQREHKKHELVLSDPEGIYTLLGQIKSRAVSDGGRSIIRS